MLNEGIANVELTLSSYDEALLHKVFQTFIDFLESQKIGYKLL